MDRQLLCQMFVKKLLIFRTMNERVFSEPQFGLSSNYTFFKQWVENNFEGALYNSITLIGGYHLQDKS